MKKIFIILIIMFCIMPVSFCTDINLTDFSNEIRKYSNDVFPELGDENFLASVMTGEINIEKGLFQKIVNLFFNELI